MTTFLQAYADKVDTKLRINLKIVEDFFEITEEVFLLPDQKSAFGNITKNLYDGSKKPTYVTEKEFQKGFIDYTLDLNFSTVDPETLTQHYNNLFKLKENEAEAAFSSLLLQQNAELSKMRDQANATTAANIEKYTADKEASAEETPFDTVPTEPSSPDATDEDAEPRDPKEWAGPPEFAPSSMKPPTANSRPVKEFSGMSTANANTMTELPSKVTINLEGIDGDRLVEPVPAPLLFPGDIDVKCENNAGVIFGRDELYRIRGHTKAGACYLYAGRSPNNIQTEVKAKKSPFMAGAAEVGSAAANLALKKPNDLIRDAAYLYLSQKADVDTLLKVAIGTYGKVSHRKIETRQGFSLAALKADDVVIMARESGIRLITGTDETNSRGGKLSAKFGIDLIAGNDDTDLQPFVKGKNLTEYLKTLSKVVSELRGVLYNFITSQIDMNAALSDHTHYDPFSMFLGALSAGSPLVVNKGQNYMSQKVMKAGVKAQLDGVQMQKNIISIMQNRTNNDNNAFGKLGKYKILSEKNRTN